MLARVQILRFAPALAGACGGLDPACARRRRRGCRWRLVLSLGTAVGDGPNAIRDFPNKTETTQNHRRFLDRLWTTVSGFDSLPPSHFSSVFVLLPGSSSFFVPWRLLPDGRGENPALSGYDAG